VTDMSNDCPFNDPLHDHHDGCPSCYSSGLEPWYYFCDKGEVHSSEGLTSGDNCDNSCNLVHMRYYYPSYQ